MSTQHGKKEPDDSVPQVTVEHEAVVDTTHTIDPADIKLINDSGPHPARKGDAAPLPPIEATAELPILSERDISAMADPHNASSPMATDGPGRRDDNATPEHGSGAPIPWPFSN